MLLIFVFSSCERTNISSIPSAPVDLRLNLSTDYKDLKIPYNLFFIEKREQTKGIYAVGYGGILVYSFIDTHGNTQFAAFDMSCPYEAKKNIRVRAVEDNSLIVRCEKCSSTFDIGHGLGNPIAGSKTKEPLRKYRCKRANYLGYEMLYVTQ